MQHSARPSGLFSTRYSGLFWRVASLYSPSNSILHPVFWAILEATLEAILEATLEAILENSPEYLGYTLTTFWRIAQNALRWPIAV